jgi:hypothetical protein
MPQSDDPNKPYFVYKFKTPTDGYYCHKCEKWHFPEVKEYAPESREFAYNVCVSYVSLPHFISCSEEYCKEIVDGFNMRHVRIRDLSIAQGHKPVLI